MDRQAVDAIVQAIARPAQFEFDAEHQVILAPPGFTLHDVSNLLPPPDRPKQTVTMLTTEDFCEYVRRYATSNTTVFANELVASFEGIIDYHESSGGRGTCEHVVSYRCPFSEEWKAWFGNNSKAHDQISFARFLEDHLSDVATPPGADLLEMALNFQVHKSAKFLSEENLTNGQRNLRYEEDVRGTTRAGAIQVPDRFRLSIPIFFGGKSYGIDARFRYRMDNGALAVWYDLIEPMTVHRESVSEITDSIKDELSAYYVVRGLRG